MTSQDQPQDQREPAEVEARDAAADPAPEPVEVAPEAPPPVPEPTEPAETVSAPAEKPRRSGGIVAPLAGGAIALIAGFALAQFDILGLRPAPDDSALKALETRAATLEQDLAAARGEAKESADLLSGRIAALESAPAPDLSPLETALAGQAERLDRLDAALAGLAALPADGSVSPAQLAALAASVETLRAELAGLQSGPDADAIRALVDEELAAWESAAAEKLQAETEAARATAARAAALARLAQAAETGAPFADLLPALGADLPEAIARHADKGLPPLTQGFAEASRRALDAARRADPGEGFGDRLLSFLKAQTGARSLTPQEGADPDAVLSRAEAAVAAGEVQEALDEIATLPPEAQAELKDWVALAEDHLAFAKALQALSAEKTE